VEILYVVNLAIIYFPECGTSTKSSTFTSISSNLPKNLVSINHKKELKEIVYGAKEKFRNKDIGFIKDLKILKKVMDRFVPFVWVKQQINKLKVHR
jgi:hypothetical protein